MVSTLVLHALPPISSRNHPSKPHVSPSISKPPSSPSQLTALSIKSNVFFSNAAQSKPLHQTLKLFHLLPVHDTVTWNTAISACLRHRRADAALRIFLDMLLSTSFPDHITLRLVLNACFDSKDSFLLLQIHGYLIKQRGLLSRSEFTVLCTKLVSLYCEFELTGVARKLFDGIPDRDAVAFTSMMVGYTDAGEYVEPLRIFAEMVRSGCLEMNAYAYSCALRACVSIPALFEGQQIHGHIVKSRMGSDLFVGTGLVDLYAKCDEMESAKRVFWEISEPGVVSWNALMAGNLGREECLHLLGQMRDSGVRPDHVTFGCVLQSLKEPNVNFFDVVQVHGLIAKMMEVKLDVFVSSALFEAYINYGCFYEAQQVIDEMEEKDDASFNLVIQGYARNGHVTEAIDALFEALEMGKELREATVKTLLTTIGLHQGMRLHALVIKFGCCQSSSPIVSSLIRMYTEHHLLDDALRLFEQIHQPDIVQWTSLIAGFSRSGESHTALKLYVRMLSDELAQPANSYTFATILSSCAELAAVEEGKQIHSQIIKSGLHVSCHNFIASSLLYMYAMCGYIEEASDIFDEIQWRDLASWNAMISSLSQHGFAKRATEAFHELLNIKDMQPNHITFLAVLSACNRGGMVEKGYEYFKAIEKPTINHYACLIDMFGRAGRFKEAIDLVERMPFDANEYIWTSLLAASSFHRNIELGEYSAKQLLKLNPKDPGTYIALSNLYASAGRWKEMREIRKLMKSQADKKQSGISWIRRVRGKKYVFSADSRSHI
ncbi:putative pentatricopeptide repeat-containing protein At3g25970 [Typha angustifolia]|uniref:putative pentatricopeptide repeat-containing protein At3g25970 n=1 Tax=Typha angustifolia TaxID=59011 RepID=UPI003C2DA04C